MTPTPIACSLCGAAPPLKGQRWQPGKAGSAAFSITSARVAKASRTANP